MRKKQNKAVKWLLPLSHKFRIAGILLFLVSVAGAIVLYQNTGSRAVFDLVDSQKENVSLCSLIAIGFLAGLFLIAATKEKKEDEQYLKLRVNALGLVFVLFVLNIFSQLKFSGMFSLAVKQYTGADALISLLVLYLLVFHIMRGVFLWRNRAEKGVPEVSEL